MSSNIAGTLTIGSLNLRGFDRVVHQIRDGIVVQVRITVNQFDPVFIVLFALINHILCALKEAVRIEIWLNNWEFNIVSDSSQSRVNSDLWHLRIFFVQVI